MRNLTVLLIKFAAGMVVFYISLDLYFEASLAHIFSFSLLLTIVSYFGGDQILLPRIGNRNALVTDFFLTYLIVWIFGGILFDSYLQVAWGSIISALLFTGAEVFVHSYILKYNSQDLRDTKQSFNNQRFAYEFAEDQDPAPDKE
ncbi:DUF2512 family protein [Bacillus salacetis]|uniref:DUF2512 family protein n=1 Tax=Bacillus salacetis TaxID=2315464 RepID=A0A3A1QZJ1_9BACI|nr:YndM family protein [Bacillus salacetis]RIW34706.1 DUF2512 family protein [Bacillus salacetis]